MMSPGKKKTTHKLERLVWSDKGSGVILIYIIAGQSVATVPNKYLDSG